MQISSLSVNALGQMKSPRVDPLLEALEEFLRGAYEEPASTGSKYSSPTPLSVSLSLKLQSPKEQQVVVSLSLEGSWTPSRMQIHI